MGKGSKPRPVSKNYGAEYERIYGVRCLRHRKANCSECFPESTKPEPPRHASNATTCPSCGLGIVAGSYCGRCYGYN